MFWKKVWSSWFAPKRPLAPGLYQYRGSIGERNYRLHLRIEKDGRGLLAINASKILHLNQTAAEMAKHLVEGDDDETVIQSLAARYRGASRERLRADYSTLKQKIQTLAASDDICPITYLDVERIEPFCTPVSAPYRMDLALTYKCDNACGHCYLPRGRMPAEMDTAQWKKAISKLWEIGVPHVCFTGGEATLRKDLPDLVAYAEETGLVTGLLSNGCRLSDPHLVRSLVTAGLDHFQLTLESHDPKIHDKMVGRRGAWRKTVKGIENALASPVYTITNTTITKLNAQGLPQTLKFLKTLGLKTVALNGLIYSGQGATCGLGFKEEELAPILNRARQAAQKLGLRLIWYTPTRYCHLDPVKLELGVKACTAAKYNMCLEPDGSAIPCQSWFEPLGNILHDPWEKIWNAELARELRERLHPEAECRSCDRLPLCGGGCPIYNRQAEVMCLDSKSNA